MERTFHVPSTLDQVAPASRQILDILSQRNYGSETLFRIRLCFEEALANAIKHGNQQAAAKKVAIHFHLDDAARRLVITIKDEGKGFDPSKATDSRGYGLVLIRHFMDEVKFNSQGNQIEMTKRL